MSDAETPLEKNSLVLAAIRATESEIIRSAKFWPKESDAAIAAARSVISLIDFYRMVREITGEPDSAAANGALDAVHKLAVAVMELKLKASGQSNLLKPKGRGRGRGPATRKESLARLSAVLAVELLVIAGEREDVALDIAAERLIATGWGEFAKLGASLKYWRDDDGFTRSGYAVYRNEFEKLRTHYRAIYKAGSPLARREAEERLRLIPDK